MIRSLVCLALLAGPVAAMTDAERVRTAQNLAAVLAGEEHCGLTYDQQALADHTAELTGGDMEFPAALNGMLALSRLQIADHSNSERTAFCASIKAAAEADGFLKP